MTDTIRVDLAGRDYHVRIGAALLDEAGAEVAPLLNRPRLTVVADARVAALHGVRLQAGLEAGGVSSEIVTVPPGEGSKSFAELERLCGRLLDLNLDRRDTLAAFGGGVVGDLAGFAAAIYKRGLPFIQIPTTLLAQVDSSVGGKTAIDTAHGKNLIGAFHQPRLVLASTAVLGTLPPRELRAGLAEVIKAALIEDAAFFAELERDLGALLALEPAAIQAAIARAVRIKAAIVAADEFETTGRRALLNLGHTFGHAIEAEDGFDGLLHGEAVAIGCVLALRFSASEGLCARADAERAEALFAAAGLPTRLPPGRYRADALLARMAQDKKNTGGLTLILARGLGRAYVAPGVDPAAVRAFLIAEGALP